MQDTWNSLEVVKLIVGALGPITVVGLGFLISYRLKKLEQIQWSKQKVVEKKLEIYSKLAPLLNDMYCYFDYIGDWRSTSPLEILSVKIESDRLFHVNASLFSELFRMSYDSFINQLFEPGPLLKFSSSAKLKTNLSIRLEVAAEENEAWPASKRDWSPYFASIESSAELIATSPNWRELQHAHLRKCYDQMMNVFVSELGLVKKFQL